MKAKEWVIVNDKSNGNYKTSNQIMFAISFLRSNFCDCGDVPIANENLWDGKIAV